MILPAKDVFPSPARISAPAVRFTQGQEWGSITYTETYAGKLVLAEELTGLRGNSVYAFSLNGKVGWHRLLGQLRGYVTR